MHMHVGAAQHVEKRERKVEYWMMRMNAGNRQVNHERGYKAN